MTQLLVRQTALTVPSFTPVVPLMAEYLRHVVVPGMYEYARQDESASQRSPQAVALVAVLCEKEEPL
jgi:hypothetical protein